MAVSAPEGTERQGGGAASPAPLARRSLVAFVDGLESFVEQAIATKCLSSIEAERAWKLLNQPHSPGFLSSMKLAHRRSAGVYFTPPAHAVRLVRPAMVPAVRTFTDPACGAGDLLLEAAAQLPVSTDVSTTIRAWGKFLAGLDLDPLYVRIAKARLALFCRLRTSNGSLLPREQWFPKIVQGDGLAALRRGLQCEAVLMNPPYARRQSAAMTWGSGLLSDAALFVDAWVNGARPGQRLAALLPDVLRTGVTYQRWRAVLEAACTCDGVEILGQFGPAADIDVFLVWCTRTRPGGKVSRWTWFESPQASDETIAEHFDMSVGAVVPHRHKQVGPRRRYIHARLMKPTQDFVGPAEYRKFSGTVVRPPFVAVRRTSRPASEGSTRVICNLVLGTVPIAVENHIIVLRPLDGTVETCRQVVTLLTQKETTRWLNQRIRCRHLTVQALSQLPWRHDA